MGQDKRFLPLEGTALIDRTMRLLETLFKEVIVVLAEPIPGWSPGRHRVVYDAIEKCGSLGGLYTGVVQAASPRIFAVACDMPFLNTEVIRYLIRADPDADIIGARLRTGLQPMHAVYSKRCASVLEQMAKSGNLRIQRVFDDPHLKIRIIEEPELITLDPDLRSFQNINTPGEYRAAQTGQSPHRG
jgi:molybdopterin-guanine dinucleotide biosynthesis protein A